MLSFRGRRLLFKYASVASLKKRADVLEDSKSTLRESVEASTQNHGSHSEHKTFTSASISSEQGKASRTRACSRSQLWLQPIALRPSSVAAAAIQLPSGKCPLWLRLPELPQSSAACRGTLSAPGRTRAAAPPHNCEPHSPHQSCHPSEPCSHLASICNTPT